MRTWYAILVAVLITSSVSALSITPSYSTQTIIEEIQNPITLYLNINNAQAGEYNIYTLADLQIEPSQIFSIGSGDTTKIFTITPNENFKARGLYTFTYTLNHRGVEKLEERATFEVLPLIDVISVGSDSINPESKSITFYVENTADVHLNNISARFSSILFDISETIDLKPFEKEYIPVTVDPSKLKHTKAGIYIIDANFETPKGLVKTTGNLYLGEKKGITTTEDTAGFLISTKTINKINAGNVLESVEISTKKNILTRLITNFNIEPNIVEREGLSITYKWIKPRLGPGEVFTVKSTTNYLIPLLILAVFIAVYLTIRRITMKKVDIKKSVSPVKTKNGEFALKVKIRLKAKRTVENVTVIDRVPAMVKIYKKFGPLEPEKIDIPGRRIHWKLEDLNIGEERTLTYIVYSKVGYVGKFSLPPALAVFEIEGDLHESESNRVFFFSDQASSE